jgi:O-antigen/teichoic acid export membrane protein
LYTLLGIIISLIVSALSAQMISIVYGQKFFESIEVLRVYALSIVFVYIINFYTALSGAKDNHKSQVTALVFGLILNIITVILFTFIWGLTGTAWATVLSYGFVAIILHYKNKT